MRVDGKYVGEGVYTKRYKLYNNAWKRAKLLYGHGEEMCGSKITYEWSVEEDK